MSNFYKNNTRKVMTTSAAAALAVTAVSPVVASADTHTFSDVPTDHYYFDQIEALAEAGVIQGDESGEFNPNGSMSRASAAEMLAKALDLEPGDTNPFDDVPDSHWAADSISALYEAGVVQGDEDGLYNPTSDLSRAAIAEMVVKAYGLDMNTDNEMSFDDVSEDDWFANNVNILASHGLVEGDGEGFYSPRHDMQRQHFAKLVYDAEVAYGDIDNGNDQGDGENGDQGNDQDPLQDLEIDSLSVVDAQTVEVSFNQDFDINDVDFNVSNDDMTQSISEVSLEGETVTLVFEDELEPNTTYDVSVHLGDDLLLETSFDYVVEEEIAFEITSAEGSYANELAESLRVGNVELEGTIAEDDQEDVNSVDVLITAEGLEAENELTSTVDVTDGAFSETIPGYNHDLHTTLEVSYTNVDGVDVSVQSTIEYVEK
ncbi:hypothetical protein ABID56_002583 [Alkalibacillus flavidus]|uniref:SLH domain-containing protein n=1 Tax=Alkalibacillus flavidus TaxID=546021 RepID=A0ABV2L0V7_9BACI